MWFLGVKRLFLFILSRVGDGVLLYDYYWECGVGVFIAGIWD